MHMYARFWKRLLDFLLALTALLVLSPLLLLLTLAGAVAMRGNPFFAQPRPGREFRGKIKKINLPFTDTTIYFVLLFR